MEKSVEKFYGEHYKYMQRAMWCMDAAIGEAARFSKVAIVSTDGFIKRPDCKTGIDAALNADDTINVMVIVDSKSEATTLLNTPILDCITALEKCCESEEVKQLLEVYKKNGIIIL